jgi:hypothetical protein
MAVIRTANAITAEIMTIVSGDEDAVCTVTGLFVGLKPAYVVNGVEWVTDWVTVNVVMANWPWVPVAVTGYVPGDTCGTLSVTVLTPYTFCGYAVPKFAVPRVMLTGLGAG